ncbi:hypothetical protein [Kocuria sp.]|uniref:hypothetical protein n=1 Tax=Kocuria sp. TaxID=1871328 RepID=UPI0028AD83D7|nr:hypothetical protein [Kocuria sp.]
MSRQYSSRTISDLAKKLGKHTEAPHRERLRTLEQAAKITTVPITRALLALQQLEREGRSVNVAGLHKTLGHKVSAPMPPSSNGRGHSVPTPSEGPERERLHEAFKMPTAFSGVDDPTSLRDQANREFETPRWWFGGRSLGVYGADLRRRGLLVRYLIRKLMHNGYRTIAPMRAPSKADQRMLAPSAEVVDLTTLPGGIRQLHEELEERTTAGETLVVLVVPRHGLDEDDLSVLVELLYLPLPSLRVLYAESFVVRGWSEFMDAMLTYGESMLLGPARAADLEAFGLPADYEMPTGPGAGIYLVDGGYTVRFGAPQRVSTYSSAHQANNRWGPCGHRPKASLGSLPVALQKGDVLRFWGDKDDRGWKMDGATATRAIGVCWQEDLDSGSGAPVGFGPQRRQIISFQHGLREDHPFFYRPIINAMTDLRSDDEVAVDVKEGRLQFTDGAVRLDLRSVERNGRIIWSDES